MESLIIIKKDSESSKNPIERKNTQNLNGYINVIPQRTSRDSNMSFEIVNKSACQEEYIPNKSKNFEDDMILSSNRRKLSSKKTRENFSLKKNKIKIDHPIKNNLITLEEFSRKNYIRKNSKMGINVF